MGPSAHLSADSHVPASAPLGREDAARSELLANVMMVLYGVKFGVGKRTGPQVVLHTAPTILLRTL